MSGVDETKGKVKQAVGDITDNDRLKREGAVDKAKGKVKNAVDSIGEKLKGK